MTHVRRQSGEQLGGAGVAIAKERLEVSFNPRVREAADLLHVTGTQGILIIRFILHSD